MEGIHGREKIMTLWAMTGALFFHLEVYFDGGGRFTRCRHSFVDVMLTLTLEGHKAARL